MDMFINQKAIIDLPILSLRSGGQIGKVSEIVINPYNLSVQALALTGRMLDYPKGSFLLPKDIREISDLGIVINDGEDIVSSKDVIKLAEILDLRFELDNLPVFDKYKTKIGKVVDYNFDIYKLEISQLIVRRPLLKDFLEPELIIGRNQILEVSQSKVIIKSSLSELRSLERQEEMKKFVNPFSQGT